MVTQHQRLVAVAAIWLCAGLAAGAQSITREDIRRAMAGVNLHPEIQASVADSGWADVRALKPGTTLRITADSPPMSRDLRRVEDDGIIIWRRGEELRIPRDKIREIAVPDGMSRGHHVMLGFLIGGTIGAIVAAVHCHGQGACMEGSPAYFYPAAGIGALVGAALPVTSSRIVYRRP